MNTKIRLTRLEQQKNRFTYPTFSEMCTLLEKTDYNEWMIEHNKGLSQSMIDGLDVLPFEYL